MLVLWKALHGTHRRTAKCARGAERRRHRLTVEEEREVTTRHFSDYGHPLKMVNSFKYLGQVISATDDDWPAVVKKLAQAKTVWRRMSQILSRE